MEPSCQVYGEVHDGRGFGGWAEGLDGAAEAAHSVLQAGGAGGGTCAQEIVRHGLELFQRAGLALWGHDGADPAQRCGDVGFGLGPAWGRVDAAYGQAAATPAASAGSGDSHTIVLGRDAAVSAA